jgi:hypothetical protein
MAALSWLLIPILATVVASAWSSWASRRRTGIPDSAGVAGYERFRAAMERSRGDETVEVRSPVGVASGAEPIATGAGSTPDGPARTAE